MLNLGVVRPGATIYIPFHTFDSNDPSASVTLTGLAVTDIEVYKDGGTTQRASDAGYTLLDTDGIDFDGITGVHGFSINLADNTTAGFWASGSQYWVVVSSITVDAATINFVAATFRIGYPDALLDTTIATLSSQTSFTLTVGPAEDDALNGCVCVIHDVASAVQLGFAVVSDYTGSTKTVTLTAGVTFTAAATDNISFYPPANARWFAALATSALPLAPTVAGRTLDVSAGGEAGVDWANVGSPTTAQNLSGTTIANTQDVNVRSISGDVTAADNAEAFFDGTGYAGTNNVIPTVTSVTNAVTANVTQISGDTAAADNLEAEYDGTGFKSYLRRNTAQAGGASTITLDASASASDDYYNNQIIGVISGTGAGQGRIITDYVGATKVSTVNTAWVTQPSSDSVFVILPYDSVPGASAPTAAQVADAVWDEAIADHVGAGSAGERVERLDIIASGGSGGLTNARAANLDNLDAAVSSRSTLTAAAAADAVWDEAQADHVGAGTFGEVATETGTLQTRLGTPIDFGSGTSTIAANLQDMADNGTATFDRSTDSLQALRDRGDAAWTTATGFSTHTAADVWAVATRVLTAGTNIDGSTFSAIPWNAAWDAEVESEVNDALNTAIAELTGDAGATPTLRQAVMLLYMALRNRRDTTATVDEIHNNAGAVILDANVSDDGTTFTKSVYANP